MGFRKCKKGYLEGNVIINISPNELQIPYKLFLGSQKDLEDAKYLYKLFGKKIDRNLFDYFLEKLDKKTMFNKYLK